MLSIQNLHVLIQGKEVLKGLTLEVGKGEIHALMGPNGAGKSTLAKVLAGHPSCEITKGEIWFRGQNLLELEVEERSALGLFMSFQYPPEIPGVSNLQFLFQALNAHKKANQQQLLTEKEFEKLLEEKMKLVEMKQEFIERGVNEGFSGGEKKRNEILQMALLEPTLAILDETDSGLDIDALRLVAKGVNRFFSPEKSLILITHYQRLLDLIQPHYVHIFADGKIVRTGGPELALELEKVGYEKIFHPLETKMGA